MSVQPQSDPAEASLFTHHSWKHDEKGVGCPLYTAFGFTGSSEVRDEFGEEAGRGAMAVVSEYDSIARSMSDGGKVVDRTIAQTAWMKAIDAVEGVKDTSVAKKAASILGWK